MFLLHRHGALARACAIAAFLLAIFILAFSAPHARAQEITVFGQQVSIGAVPSTSRPRFAASLELPSRVTPRAATEILRGEAQALGVPVQLALAVTNYESGGRCGMRGHAGERGAMQVLPQTARLVGVKGNLYDCATGIEAGLRYLRVAMMMHARAGWCAVASAYNRGTWRGSICTRYGRAIALAARMR